MLGRIAVSRMIIHIIDSFGDLLDLSPRRSSPARRQFDRYAAYLLKKTSQEEMQQDFYAVGKDIRLAIKQYEAERQNGF